MPFELGDVILVPFPFTDLSATKKRPALVVSSRRFNSARPDVVIVAVTSQVRPARGIGEAVLSDWQSAGLARESVTKPIVATVDSSLAIRKLGTLSGADCGTVRAALAEILG